ncbi:peptide-methionine (S)-S-oxide reductase MsrA [Croceiramulus getboli]|nr:peptide-methionine (S)-S-oxide reductase MsrA [Flavobacteriaceae bacterium YJPT1-3]
MNEKLPKATFANGCFWCTEAVFQRLQGVSDVISGYTGGNIKNPAYREVCQGRTGHAEAIQFTYDPELISFRELLEVFFATHDPTTLNRQGADVGTQYRSAIFYHDQRQKEIAEDYMDYLEKEGVFDDPIVTELSPLDTFYTAEQEHLDYYNRNKSQLYCQYVINPKVAKIRATFSSKLKPEYTQ